MANSRLVLLDVLQRAALAEQQRLAVVDGAAVYAQPTYLAGHAAIFNFWTTIHDDVQPGLTRHGRCFFADDTKLHPDGFEAEAVFLHKSFFHDAGRGIGSAEDVHQIDRR